MKLNILAKLFILCIIIGAASCKKESNNNNVDSYVKFNLNGQWVKYEALGELGPDLMDPSKTGLVISGWSEDKTTTFGIGIQIDGSDFKTGNYSTDEDPYYMIVDYIYFPPDDSKARSYECEDASGREPSKYVVKITSITAGQIKGSFTGNYLYDYFHDDDPDGGILKITEGEFQVNRIR